MCMKALQGDGHANSTTRAAYISGGGEDESKSFVSERKRFPKSKKTW